MEVYYGFETHTSTKPRREGRGVEFDKALDSLAKEDVLCRLRWDEFSLPAYIDDLSSGIITIRHMQLLLTVIDC